MIHSFLLIGQSNMAGRGLLQEALPIDASRIYVLKNGRFQTMYRPVNPDRVASGVCLAESFAERYAQIHDVDVGLICCADGGSTLDQWKPGSLLFDHAVYQAKLAARSSTIMGVLWHQGESDCKPEQYSTYQSRLQVFIDALREDLQLQDVPFLLGGLGDFLQNNVKYPEVHNYRKVNAALQALAKSNPLTGFVSAEGLPGNADNLHFSAKGLYDFGLRYLETYQQIAPKNRACSTQSEDTMQRSSMELL